MPGLPASVELARIVKPLPSVFDGPPSVAIAGTQPCELVFAVQYVEMLLELQPCPAISIHAIGVLPAGEIGNAVVSIVPAPELPDE